MTEAEWLACRDSHPMWVFLRGKLTSRQQRLLYCGCCRQVWHLLVDDRSRRAVDAAERFADGLIKGGTLRKYYLQANYALQRVEADDDPTPPLKVHATAFAMCTTNPHPGPVMWYDDEMQKLQDAQEAYLLRDIFGNPFRPVTIDPTWRSWNNGTTVQLAQTIYDERDLPSGHLDAGRLAILGDALEDDGCTNADILTHCRQPGEHVRGCWALDLVLNKQ
jgi:hypothetical protein